MADRHQIIQDAVKVEWTKSGRGRLYNSPQVLAIPYKDFQRGVFIPKWFGALKRRFKGFPDTFGFEYTEIYERVTEAGTVIIDDIPTKMVPVFCTVEIKTRNDNLSIHQKRVMGFLVSIGALCYIAKENKNDDEWKLERWIG